MSDRTVITSAAALAAIGLLSLLLAYRYEPSAAQSDEAPDVSTSAPTSPSSADSQVPETVGQECQQAVYVAYSPTNITIDTLPPGEASNELCVPLSALRPDGTIVGAFLTEAEACNFRNQNPGTSIRALQLPNEPDPCG